MSSIQIRESSQGPFGAKELRLQCPHCFGAVFVPLPWNPTIETRQRLVQAAIEEHRRLCQAAPAEAARVYTISYPRA